MKRLMILLTVSLWLFVSCQSAPDYLFVVTDETTDPSASQEEGVSETPAMTETDRVPDTSPLETPESDKAPESTTELRDVTEPETQPSGITLLSMSKTVKRGNQATVTVKGTAGITYTIKVYYATTVSQASGLEPKVAAEDGTVTWTWRVGSRTKEGTHKIEIIGGDHKLTLSFTTTA